MEVLCVDLGKYAIKFIRGRIERKEFICDDIVEELLAEHLPPTTDEDTLNNDDILETQVEMIKSYLDRNPEVEKFVVNLPNEYTTTRYLSIPVKSKNKAEQIIPFQLEDELPFSMSEAHIGNLFINQKEGMYVICSITKRDIFNKLYFKFGEENILPEGIVSEESVFQNISQIEDLGDHVAILDIGHVETKCYMFQNKVLVDSQTSFLAGKVVEEVIQETYQIPNEEAVIFKHQNSFFLTDDQIESVNKEQRDFALLMKRIFQTLVNDFKRWKVGYRLKTGHNITKVYICGGTSNIKNIENFLTESFEVSVTTLDALQRTSLMDLDLKDSEVNLLNKAYFLSHLFINRKALCDFKTGDYATSSEGVIPLHSISFLGLRSAIVALVLILVFIIEGGFLNRQVRTVTAKTLPILKNPGLGISNKLRNAFRTNPQRVNSFIKSSMGQLDSEVDTLQAVSTVNALAPLGRLSRIIEQADAVELRRFETRNESVIIQIYSEQIELLEKVQRVMEEQNYEKLRVDITKGQNLLNASYFDRGE